MPHSVTTNFVWIIWINPINARTSHFRCDLPRSVSVSQLDLLFKELLGETLSVRHPPSGVSDEPNNVRTQIHQKPHQTRLCGRTSGERVACGATFDPYGNYHCITCIILLLHNNWSLEVSTAILLIEICNLLFCYLTLTQSLTVRVWRFRI